MLDTAQEIINGLQEAQRLNREPALVYDRVSTEEQAKTGYSLNSQQTHAGEYANRQGLHVVHYFTVAESARGKIERKAFTELLRVAVQFGIHHMIFLNADRMTRNYRDFLKIEELVEKHGASIHFYQDGTIYNKESTHNDRFVMNIKIAVAKQRTDEISQHAKQTHRTRAKRGIPPAPFIDGYKFSKQDKRWNIDTEREHIIRYLFDAYDYNRISLRDLAEKLKSMGYRTSRGLQWSQSSLHRILTSRIYTGSFEFEEQIYPGNYEPYITPERFEKRLKQMGLYRPNEKSRNFEFIFRGLLRYRGHMLTGELIKRRYVYYSNKIHKVRFREEDIIAQVDDAVSAMEYSPDFAEKLKSLFRDAIIRKTKSQDTDKRRIAKEKARLEDRRRRLLDLYLDDAFSADDLREKSNEIRLQIESLEMKERAFRVDKDEHIFNIARLIDNLRNIASLYKQAEIRDRIKLIEPLLENIDLTSGQVVMVWKPEFRWILNDGVLEHSDAFTVRNRSIMHARRESNP